MIGRLQYITPNKTGQELYELVETVCSAGVDWVQLRLKGVDQELYLSEAKIVRTITTKFNAKLIINDNVDVAIDSSADGVHIGKEDVSVSKARKKLGVDLIIGGTANTIEDVQNHIKNGVDYIGLGPFQFTTTKKNLSPELGLEGYKKIIDQVGHELPIVGIGGIMVEDVEGLIETGLHGIAISGAISNVDDPALAATKFMESIEHQTELIK